MEKVYDRRSDVGQKVFIGIITALLTSVFLGALGMSIRNSEQNHSLEVRVVKMEVFIANQDRLNDKLSRLLERGDLHDKV